MTSTIPQRREALVARGRPENGRSSGGDTRARARQSAEAAQDEMQAVAGTVAERAGEVADASRQQAAVVARELSDEARGVLSDARHQLHDQAQAQTERMVDVLYRLVDESAALVEGDPERAPTLARYLDSAAVRLEELADHVEARGAQGMLDDMESFARQRPGAFLLGAGVAGMVVGRALRSAGDGDGDASALDGGGGPPSPPRRPLSPAGS